MNNPDIAKRYEDIKNRIAAAVKKAPNPKEDISLVCVSKQVDAQRINEAIAAGVRLLGESRAQEVSKKHPSLDKRDELKIHFIGHMQTNKVGKIVQIADVFQSVDSLRLIEEINRQCGILQKKGEIFIQVKPLEDPAKFGIDPGDLPMLLREIGQFPHIFVTGLMAILPFGLCEGEMRAAFRRMYQLYIDTKGKKYDNVSMDFLSMGMSGDFEIAIEEGANMVRVGSLLFGKR